MDKKHFYSNAGSPIKITYTSHIDRKGNIIVEETGKENLYEKIQSFADQCDINNIVKRFEAGDLNALSQRQAQFMDLTQVPTDYFEMVNKINDAKQEFYKLPTEIKQKFDNDENKFIATIGSEEWFAKLSNQDVKEIIEEVKEEKKDGEVNG